MAAVKTLSDLMSRAEVASSGCIEWMRGLTGDGYAKVWFLGKHSTGHRVAWKLTKGSIPEGLVIDHLCRNRKCINPDHMELVTIAENTMRGEGACARHARKTHCVYGHVLSGGNLGAAKDRRLCKQCDNRRQKEYKLRKRRIGI